MFGGALSFMINMYLVGLSFYENYENTCKTKQIRGNHENTFKPCKTMQIIQIHPNYANSCTTMQIQTNHANSYKTIQIHAKFAISYKKKKIHTLYTSIEWLVASFSVVSHIFMLGTFVNLTNLIPQKVFLSSLQMQIHANHANKYMQIHANHARSYTRNHTSNIFINFTVNDKNFIKFT